MNKFAVGVEYIGSQYAGWQRQPTVSTIQGNIEAALARIANASIEITCAGRTDKGVHAYGQVIHFSCEASRSLDAWLRGANTFLPADIRLQWIAQASESFHARYSATARRYHYVVHQGQSATAILPHTTWDYRCLDVDQMQNAANHLLGEHDFSSFRAAECQAHSPFRCVHQVRITRKAPYILFDITANAFLHHMVRNIVGSLLMVGSGEKPVSWLRDVLEAKDRKTAGPTAKPNGLYLAHVYYPPNFALPRRAPSAVEWMFDISDVPEHMASPAWSVYQKVINDG